MTTGNGRTTWLLWTAGALLTIIMFGMGILCSGVIANEIRNNQTHKEMVAERNFMFSELLKESNVAHSNILQRLSRIEALLK